MGKLAAVAGIFAVFFDLDLAEQEATRAANAAAVDVAWDE